MNRVKTQTIALTKRHSQALLRQIERSLQEIEAEIKTRLRATDHGARAHDILCSIPGISDVTAAAILIECPEIGTLGRKQIASLAGLAPMARQSGQWRGHAFIQGGRKFLRDALYMPALVAVRFNPDMATKYQTMCAAGKQKRSPLQPLCANCSNAQTPSFAITENGLRKLLDQDGYSKGSGRSLPAVARLSIGAVRADN